jgi:hypothetical protein
MIAEEVDMKHARAPFVLAAAATPFFSCGNGAGSDSSTGDAGQADAADGSMLGDGSCGSGSCGSSGSGGDAGATDSGGKEAGVPIDPRRRLSLT